MIQSFSEALAPSSRVRVGSAVGSTVMSTTTRNKALDTTSRTSQRFVLEAVTAAPPLRRQRENHRPKRLGGIGGQHALARFTVPHNVVDSLPKEGFNLRIDQHVGRAMLRAGAAGHLTDCRQARHAARQTAP